MGIQTSFMISYIILLTTATICFIEAIRTQSPMIRHIFNLETCISVVAGYFYFLFIEKVKDIKKINWKELTELRYLDWAITTPMMLIVLCAALAYNIKVSVQASVIIPVIILNYIMLYFGYMGESFSYSKRKDKVFSGIISFAAFFMMYAIIFYYYVRPKYNLPNYIFYTLYLVAWTLYGVVYYFDEETKNICLNALDVFSKSLIGIGLWFYYTKIIT